MKFFKYHSLGNDFILIDAIVEPALRTKLDKNSTQSICHRHFGIGADGILIIHQPEKNKNVQCEILNSDGSKAELCINGVRCIAHYLFNHHRFPSQFILEMNQRSLECHVEKRGTNVHITLNTGKAEFYQEQTISLADKKLISGDFIKFSNPHFVIFKDVDNDTLLNEGRIISTHANFPHQTNVAYVFKENIKKDTYHVSFYERGAGITLSCGSGVSAVMWALYKRKEITDGLPITLQMQGGSMQCTIDKDNNIIQKASAHLVFIGTMDIDKDKNKWIDTKTLQAR